MRDLTYTIDLSIVVPVYNEEVVLGEFHDRLAKVLNSTGLNCEIIMVNDGSIDNTLAKMRALQLGDPRIVIVDLSRNFGKEIALTAGLDHATGQAAVPIDADLQDPPELIVEMVAKWREGYPVVLAKRATRAGESWLKKKTAGMFYGLMQRLDNKVTVPRNVGDFRLMDRKVLDALKQMREHHRFMKGLFATVGYHHATIEYDRDPRFAGETKFNYWRLWNFSLEGITSYTTAPLRIATYLGFTVAGFAFLYGLFIVMKAILYGDPVAGFPTLFAMVAFLGGLQLMFLGIIGEYLGRIFNETKGRPLYFVNEVLR